MGGLIANYYTQGSGAPTDPPPLVGEWGWYQDEDTGNIYGWSPVDEEWTLLGLAAVEYPKRATMFHEDALYTSGAGTIAHDTAVNYLLYNHDATALDGDTFTHSFFVEAGTYTLSAMGYTANNRGKLDWYVDDVLQGAGGQDWYSAGVVANVVKTLSITVVGDGYHVLKGVVNGKNASSSGYIISLTKYWITPSSD